MERLIFYVDVNSAFLSWTAAKILEETGTDIRMVPSAIGGDREKRTGVILAKSIPAKKFGIKTGEPVAMALRKCPDLKLFRPDFSLYMKKSRAFVEICRRFAPVVEQNSIDECALDMTGTGRIYPDPVEIAYKIKDTVREELGFTVNVGIGRNRLTAKMASDMEKPDKVHTLFPEEIGDKMWPLPVGDLFCVGSSTAERLTKAGIRTIGDLAQSDLQRVERIVGSKTAKQIHDYANGIDRSAVRAEAEEAKGYSISTTLEEDVTDVEQANRILLALSDSVSARMRADGARACCIGVTVRSNTFQNRSHQQKLEIPTDITSEIYGWAKRLFSELWDGRTPLRLLGISLTDVTRGETEQISLFRDEKREKARKLDQTLDGLRDRFGMDAVRRASNVESGIEVGKKYRAQLEQRKGKS